MRSRKTNELTRPPKRQHARKRSRTAVGPRNHSSDDEYRVGPGRPPKEYQFKPGQSGNPRGAKRKAQPLLPDLKDIFQRAFNQKITVTEGERERVLTMWTAGMQQLSAQFAMGDRHARHDVFWIAEKLGPEVLMPTKMEDRTLSLDQQGILDDYVARRTGPNIHSKPVFAPPELMDDDKSER